MKRRILMWCVVTIAVAAIPGCGQTVSQESAAGVLTANTTEQQALASDSQSFEQRPGAVPLSAQDISAPSTTAADFETMEPSQIKVAGNDSIPLRVLYLARNDADRNAAFRQLFERHFTAVSVRERQQFVPAEAEGFDVVVLDWSQDDRPTGQYDSPLGDLENWSTPTVFLGSAGLLMAGPWNIIGGAG